MTWRLRKVKSRASVHFFMALLDSNPASNHWEYTLDRELHQRQWASKNKESDRHYRPAKGFTWVYTVETTCVDTLKMAFPPSTHFTSAPFCQTEKERKSPTVRFIFIPSHVWYFSSFLFFGRLVTLVLLASLIAKYPGGRLHETGMLNSWDDRRPSLSSGSQAYPTERAQTNTKQRTTQESGTVD